MPRLPRRTRRALAALALVATACAEGSALEDAARTSRPSGDAPTATSSTSSTTSTTSTSTSTTSTTTTTTLPPPAPGSVAVRTPSGILALVYGADATGAFIVGSPCDRRVTVPAGVSQVVRRIDVLLDPGHGGVDPGATAPNGMTEAELNLDVALRTAELLRRKGITVELTRDDDYFRTIADRAQLAVAVGPKAFVSIHHNGGIASPVRGPIGSEVYHQVADDESRRLGGLVYESLERELGALGAAWSRSARFGARARTNSEGTDFYGVLRRSSGVPAVLIEGAYLSSPSEAALLATDAFRDAEARAVAAGIERWLTTPDQGTGHQQGFVEDGTGGTTDLRTCRDPRLDEPRR